MKYVKFCGIIINRYVVKETDRFLTIYTQEDGKIKVYAKGIRSIKSKRGSQLDLFSHIKFELYVKGDRRTLTSVELLDGHHISKTSLNNISRLFQIGELVDALTVEHDPNGEVYELLVTALANLSRFETDEYLYRFKKKLLDHLGFGDPGLTPDTINAYIESIMSHTLKSVNMISSKR